MRAIHRNTTEKQSDAATCPDCRPLFDPEAAQGLRTTITLQTLAALLYAGHPLDEALHAGTATVTGTTELPQLLIR